MAGSLSTDSQSQRPVPVPRHVPRRCYLCNSPAHLATVCPQRSSGGGFTPKPNTRPQVNFCRTKQKADSVSHQPKQSTDGVRVTRDCSAGAATCSNLTPVSFANLQHESSCEFNTDKVVAQKCDSSINHTQLAK